MGDKYPVLTPREVISKLKCFGFEYQSQKGSHIKYIKKGIPTRIAVIPNHDTVAKGTLKSILEKCGIELEEFMKR